MYEKDLGNGLLLRWVKPEDVPKVGEGMIDVFSPPNTRLEFVRTWFLRFIDGYAGFMTEKDCVVIVDTKQDGEPLVGFTSYWQETHTYEGIPYKAGRPEFVGIMPNPEYRGKRLQQHIMDALHARSEEDGTLVQVIGGINWYYRQFGYEYALAFGERSKVMFSSIPFLKEDEEEPLKHRRATLDDVDTIIDLDKMHQNGASVHYPLARDYVISQITDYHELQENPDHLFARHTIMFEDANDNIVGYAMVNKFDADKAGLLGVYHMGLVDCTINKKAFMSSLRNIVAFGKSQVQDDELWAKANALAFYCSQWHPTVEALPSDMRLQCKIPYEGTHYYVRVPNLAAFIKHILPALNQRLKKSLTHKKYSGTIRVSNYTPRYPGFELKIERGVIVEVNSYIKADQQRDETVAYYPPYAFLQSLFGSQSIEELRSVLPDVYMTAEVKEVLDILFPKTKQIMAHLM
ncbi:hypothetical protein INT43_005740 [Umbelopsis isabellina]|uniref:GNAT family N-acetyltransferase n=1 Tax=Mortierella isabellina TaxID=91625 RepID=A0A8H7PMK8_MORIS|nr:hypothetical protein INT43_005740 [Umbelopsis isabellina]